MPAIATIVYLTAQRDAARAASSALVEQFVAAGRTRSDAEAVVAAHCARSVARLAQENGFLARADAVQTGR